MFTKDVATGEAVARRIEAGAVYVNDALHQLRRARAADGRLEGSPGLGSRHGAGGIRKYCEPQTILVSRSFPKRDIHMFPYTEKNTRRSARC